MSCSSRWSSRGDAHWAQPSRNCTTARGCHKQRPKPGKALRVRVVVSELRQPGRAPLRWVLLTNLKDSALSVVESYLLRWKIERPFYFSKVGFRLECWHQESAARIARLLLLVQLAATAVYQLSQATDPKSVEVMRRLAKLGGWSGRPKTPIGPTMLMRGALLFLASMQLLQLHPKKDLPAIALCPAGSGVRYQHREPERTLLHRIVRENLASFLIEAAERYPSGDLPEFIRCEFESHLRCGLLCHGFARVRCPTCRDELLVAFSCKNRGVCPSCSARRMADTAAHLRDLVLPEVPVRQWVLTMPKRLRFLLAWRPKLISLTLNLFLRALFAWQRRCAKRQGVPNPQCGSVTCIQRFGSALNLNLHFHTLVPNGVFSEDADGAMQFHALAPPTRGDLEKLLA